MTTITDTKPPAVRAEYEALLSQEMAQDRQNRREMMRASGVRWSGMSPDPFRFRTDVERWKVAEANVAEARRVEQTWPVKARDETTEAKRLTQQLYGELEAVSAALSRGDGSAGRAAERARQTMVRLNSSVIWMDCCTSCAAGDE
jgi:hypothetical protein